MAAASASGVDQGAAACSEGCRVGAQGVEEGAGGGGGEEEEEEQVGGKCCRMGRCCVASCEC